MQVVNHTAHITSIISHHQQQQLELRQEQRRSAFVAVAALAHGEP